MIHINEAQSAHLISHEMVFAAVTRALIAAASPAAVIFPVVHGTASDPQNHFTIKSGADADSTGLKIGAIAEAGKLNAYRTAADITLFDSSGLSLQDLYVAQAIIQAHMERGS